MTDLLSSWVLFFLVLGLSVIEKRYLNNLFTPFTVTAWPLAIISLVVNLFAVHLDFLPVTARANYFLLLNIFIIWVVGNLMAHSYKKPLGRQNYVVIFSRYREFRYFIITLSWIVILSILLRVFSILSKEGLAYIGAGEFEDKMVSGITAHLAQVGVTLLILLVLILWDTKKSLLDYITIVFSGIAIILLMVKYPIIWTILTIFFIKNLTSSFHSQIKKISYIIVFVTFLFFLNFALLFFGWGTFSFERGDMWLRISGWLVNYICSGPIMLDRWMDFSYTKPWWTLFVVIMNFTNVITGNPQRLNFVKLVSPGFMNVSPEYTSNVGTSFGTYYIIGGFTFTLLMTIIIAVISYSFYLRSFSSGKPVVIFINALFLVMGTLSFFGQYFTLVTPYYLIIIFSLFVGMFELILALKRSRFSVP